MLLRLDSYMILISWTMIFDTKYHKHIAFNYSSVMFKTAVQKTDYRPSFEGAETTHGRGLEPPSQSLVTPLRILCQAL